MTIISTRQTNIFFQARVNSQTVTVDNAGFVKANVIIGDYSEILKLFGTFRMPASFYTKTNGAPKPVTVNVEIFPPEFITDEKSKNQVLYDILNLIGKEDVDIVGTATTSIVDTPDGGIEIRFALFYPEFLVVTPTSYTKPSTNKLNVVYHNK